MVMPIQIERVLSFLLSDIVKIRCLNGDNELREEDAFCKR